MEAFQILFLTYSNEKNMNNFSKNRILRKTDLAFHKVKKEL